VLYEIGIFTRFNGDKIRYQYLCNTKERKI